MLGRYRSAQLLGSFCSFTPLLPILLTRSQESSNPVTEDHEQVRSLARHRLKLTYDR